MIQALRFLSRQMLGINRRNQELLARYNPRSLFQVVDHKLKTKTALSALGIPVVETLAIYQLHYEVRRFADDARAWNEFVIKPAQGAGGEGVVIITERQGEAFQTSEGRWLSASHLESHLSDILGGAFSLNQRYDEALVERRVHAHPLLARLSFQGLPDIRILVFRGVPLMGMLRLATRTSKGRANLHVGGIGVGIDLVTGHTNLAVLGRQIISQHPETGQQLADMAIPHWDAVLLTAAKCAEAVALGFLGVDLVIDKEVGPVVLELNARPGLSIQLANGRGLRPLVAAVDRASLSGLSAFARAQLGQELSRLHGA
jgi:alpha-L-glutamate ligase-like protein